MLKFDYSHMMADVIGTRCGILPEELSGHEASVRTIHRQLLQARNAGRLPFYDLPFQPGLDAIVRLGDDLAGRFDNLVVLGIGGSALGTRAVARALMPLHHNLLDREQRRNRPRLFVLDNIDPAGVGETLKMLRPEQTCFCVISKSGTTVETMSQFLIAREWIENAVGAQFREHFVLVTDPHKGVLRQLADDQGYRSAEVPSGVGGRFSVLSAVGLLPLAAAGVDVRSLLSGAATILPHLECEALEDNPAYLNAVLQCLAYQKGAHISVMMPYNDRLSEVADWYCQLWAESLGKKNDLDGRLVHVGPTPVKALGATDQHSQLQLYMEGPFDKVVSFVVSAEDDPLSIPVSQEVPELSYLGGQTLSRLLKNELKATAIALARAGRPNCTITLDRIDAATVGALLFWLEVQTVFAGAFLHIDPLDQPGVEIGKVITAALMGRAGSEAERKALGDWEKRLKSKVLELG